MNTENNTVTEDDLHAYVDGFLNESERQAVEAWLANNPDAAEDIRQWQSQAEGLRIAFSDYARTDDQDRRFVANVAPVPRGLPRWLSAAAAGLLLFLAGTATGIYGNRLLATAPPQQIASALDDLPAQANSAYLIYTKEVRHPVEVGADQEAHLVAWLGKRLDYKLRAPDLTKDGFHLVGGRLLPVSGKAGAMLMYEDGNGKRLTVLLGRNPVNEETSFRFASNGALETFYWIDGEIGYAVTGELTRARLQQIAEECYRQFES
ncbi:anti-sigma factor RsiW [Pararhizobium capsulatum DSM 1112]|uniref:Anti-sigma factor RsiW n=1 Tax=Pararhizobium capsulatum DSM 1112 TaxID=1121113 RepID=A0ABU0BVD3_9HYPH|nr:anti-sigma factor [Pararhizobium capsulatum]MDQ0320812.1 anti-sigma factor RsiW [Pararhizobium capsulatum DSM 1112]